MKTKDKTLLAEFGLLMITVIWGGAFVVVKNTTSAVPTNYIIGIRFGIAALLMLILFFNKIKKVDRHSVKYGAILAAILYISYLFQTIGVKYTTAGNNAFLTAIYVVMVPFLYWMIKKVKPDAYNIISAVICIVGIGLLSLKAGFTVNIGDILSLISGLTFGMHIVFTGILTEKTDPILLSFTQFSFTAVFALTAAIFTEQFPAKLETGTVVSLLYIGIFSTMIALMLQTVCQKHVPPSRASLIMSMESLFGTVFGIVFLSEKLTLKTFAGSLLIFAAILISETKPSFAKIAKLPKAEPDEEPALVTVKKEEL